VHPALNSSTLVRAWSVADQSLKLRQRNSALKEIITTERAYYNALKAFNDVRGGALQVFAQC